MLNVKNADMADFEQIMKIYKYAQDYMIKSGNPAQWAAKTDADIIVMCGVHFMGETAKILCPDKQRYRPQYVALEWWLPCT